MGSPLPARVARCTPGVRLAKVRLERVDWIDPGDLEHAPPYRAPEPHDFNVNAALFERLAALDKVDPAAAHAQRQWLARILSSQDAARMAGWPTYGIPVGTSLDFRQIFGTRNSNTSPKDAASPASMRRGQPR